MSAGFTHEKLRVYQQATGFAAWSVRLLCQVPANLAVHTQLERASISIALNIAEASSKFSATDRCRFYDASRGSALECGACLDVLVAKGISETRVIIPGKHKLHGIVSMLVGLIRSVSPTRLHEDGITYGADNGSFADRAEGSSEQVLFDHENLRVYKTSLKFVAWLARSFEQVKKSDSLWSQLDRASTSACLNIAEGNGKFTAADRGRFFRSAYGSALRCAAGLDVLAVRGDLASAVTLPGKELLLAEASMLMGLIKNNETGGNSDASILKEGLDYGYDYGYDYV